MTGDIQAITSPRELRTLIRSHRLQGQRIGLVPTMGSLHEGHMSLLRNARQRCDLLVMSLFVNPAQFSADEDLDRYPRDEVGDLAKASECGVDVVFSPDAKTMYPMGFQTSIVLPKLARVLCGQSRTDHFSGVATVVAKLFGLVTPDIAVFGQKDAQQLALIRQMVRDLNLDIEIIGGAIVREEDGLAMSSRNVYLTPEQRKQALYLSRGLVGAKKRFLAGVTNSQILVAAARAVIGAAPLVRIEYIEVCDAETLDEIGEITKPALIAVAARFGQTRLIDNLELTPLGE